MSKEKRAAKVGSPILSHTNFLFQCGRRNQLNFISDIQFLGMGMGCDSHVVELGKQHTPLEPSNLEKAGAMKVVSRMLDSTDTLIVPTGGRVSDNNLNLKYLS